MYVSGEFGRQWLGTSDAFYGTPVFPGGIPEPSYNTWNVGVGFTYKVFTLDFRYSDTNLSKGAVQRLHQRLTLRRPQPRPACPPSTRVGSSPDGAARPASSSSRLT